MANVNRRAAMQVVGAGAVAIGVAALGGAAEEPKAPKLSPLEGELKIHPKYLYRYYLLLGDGGKCALYGADHGSTPDHLAGIKLPARVQVRGVLGTAHHSGGSKENLSPFPETWTVFMDVHEVELLK